MMTGAASLREQPLVGEKVMGEKELIATGTAGKGNGIHAFGGLARSKLGKSEPMTADEEVRP